MPDCIWNGNKMKSTEYQKKMNRRRKKKNKRTQNIIINRGNLINLPAHMHPSQQHHGQLAHDYECGIRELIGSLNITADEIDAAVVAIAF